MGGAYKMGGALEMGGAGTSRAEGAVWIGVNLPAPSIHQPSRAGNPGRASLLGSAERRGGAH